MQKNMIKKGLVCAVILLFIGTGIVSALNVNLTDKQNSTMDNHPPGLPRITGPTYVSPGMHYWKFEAIDSDNDNLSYQVDWGDGYYDTWYGWYASSEEITIGHDYQTYGKFPLMARAKDTNNATGEWAGISVWIPKNKQIINQPFLYLLEQFQMLERLLSLLR